MAVKGTFKDFSFLDLLQCMLVCRKTGRVEITFENKWAMVIFRDGEVWHIEPRGFKGANSDEILYALVNMPDGNFVFQRIQVLPTLDRTLTVSSAEIIEQLVQRQETDALTGQPMGGPGAPPQVLKLRDGAESKVRYVPQNVKKILQGIDGKRTPDEVIAQSQLDPAMGAQIIKDLIAQEILEIVDAVKPEETPEPAPAS